MARLKQSVCLCLSCYSHFNPELPNMPKPRKAFGQHTNAEISSSLADTDVLMQTMIEVRGGGKKYEVLFG